MSKRRVLWLAPGWKPESSFYRNYNHWLIFKLIVSKFTPGIFFFRSFRNGSSILNFNILFIIFCFLNHWHLRVTAILRSHSIANLFVLSPFKDLFKIKQWQQRTTTRNCVVRGSRSRCNNYLIWSALIISVGSLLRCLSRWCCIELKCASSSLHLREKLIRSLKWGETMFEVHKTNYPNNTASDWTRYIYCDCE